MCETAVSERVGVCAFHLARKAGQEHRSLNVRIPARAFYENDLVQDAIQKSDVFGTGLGYPASIRVCLFFAASTIIIRYDIWQELSGTAAHHRSTISAI